jgi:Arc/MetJ-type ribon-helix-helix transcriptional regulator
MIPTTIQLPVQLHHELQFVAQRQHKSVSDVVRELLQRELVQQTPVRMTAVYAALDKVKGSGQDAITDVSATINARLYGPAGAWKGQDA